MPIEENTFNGLSGDRGGEFDGSGESLDHLGGEVVPGTPKTNYIFELQNLMTDVAMYGGDLAARVNKVISDLQKDCISLAEAKKEIDRIKSEIPA